MVVREKDINFLINDFNNESNDMRIRNKVFGC